MLSAVMGTTCFGPGINDYGKLVASGICIGSTYFFTRKPVSRQAAFTFAVAENLGTVFLRENTTFGYLSPLGGILFGMLVSKNLDPNSKGVVIGDYTKTCIYQLLTASTITVISTIAVLALKDPNQSFEDFFQVS